MVVARRSGQIAAPAPVIVDTGPLIALARAGRLELLKSLFGRVYITPDVLGELTLRGDTPDARVLRAALREGWLAKLRLKTAAEAHPFLDAGEASCIAAARRRAGALLIIDERLGRREAQRLGIALTGTAGVLCAAKARGLIDVVEPILEQMRFAGYFLGTNVIAAARREAGE